MSDVLPVSVPPSLVPQRVRHPTAVRRLRVLRSGRPSPGVISLTLGGEALQGFVSAAFDDHIKLMLPPQPGAPLVLPKLRDGRPVWPEGVAAEQQPVMRDYTPRHFDPLSLELDVEFAVHGAGPAAEWALRARPGDEVGIGGPKGSFVVPEGHDAYVLVGDDSALPAIARRLEELPAAARVTVCIEVARPEDQRGLGSRARVDLRWLVRGEAAPGQALLQAVQALPLPPGHPYLWAAGEGRTMAAVRDHWLALGHPPALMRVAAYWKQGLPGHHENLG